MEMYFKTILVFLHFLLAAMVLAQVLRTDFLLLKNYKKPLGPAVIGHIRETKKTACWCLLALYLTGGALVLYGMSKNPEYIANEKLWVKFVCVGVLTLNGFLVHKLGHYVHEGSVLSEFPLPLGLGIAVVGAVSSSSWIFACVLGIARAWNGALPFAEVMAYYGMAVGLAVSVGIVFCLMVRMRPGGNEKRYSHLKQE